MASGPVVGRKAAWLRQPIYCDPAARETLATGLRTYVYIHMYIIGVHARIEWTEPAGRLYVIAGGHNCGMYDPDIFSFSVLDCSAAPPPPNAKPNLNQCPPPPALHHNRTLCVY